MKHLIFVYSFKFYYTKTFSWSLSSAQAKLLFYIIHSKSCLSVLQEAEICSLNREDKVTLWNWNHLLVDIKLSMKEFNVLYILNFSIIFQNFESRKRMNDNNNKLNPSHPGIHMPKKIITISIFIAVFIPEWKNLLTKYIV